MARFIMGRIGTTVGVFILISMGIFGLVRAAPGDPVMMMVDPADAADGGVEFIEQKRRELGLDRPVPVQYLIWFGKAIRGDLGYSYSSHQPVVEVLSERLGPTIQLMLSALILGLLIAVIFGLIAGTRNNTPIDYGVTVLSLGAVSVPGFFLGILAIYVFALQLGVLPSAGRTTPSDGGGPVDVIRHMVMPTSILALTIAGPFLRYVRSGIITELSSDYARTAVAKGAPTPRVVISHALPNALIPLITVLALNLPGLLAGAVVTEKVFAWPGMGQLAVNAITRQDYPVVVGFVLYVAILVLVCNLVADLLYTIVDPRVRL